jgi:hypothetical protein
MTDLLGPAIPGATTERPTDNRTFGTEDTWIKDCSSDTAEDGTPLAAAFLNGLLAQCRRAIRGMGITVNNADDDMLLKAIQKAGSGYVPLFDARAYLPIYPEAETANGKLSCTGVTGQVVLDPNQSFVHRGIVRISTSELSAGERTVATTANRTYHKRWHAPGTGDAKPATSWPRGRVVLKDLSNTGYNPSSLAETDPIFDSTFDDMLIAKVVTNASNVPTVTSLVNRHRLMGRFVKTGTMTNPGVNNARASASETLDLARTPTVVPWISSAAQFGSSGSDIDFGQSVTAATRYSCTVRGDFDFATAISLGAFWQA